MRGKVAKRLRKSVYGDISPKLRKYYRHNITGQIVSNNIRQAYQKLERAYTRKNEA